MVRHRCGLPGLPGVAALARRIRLRALRPCRRVADERCPAQVRGLRCSYLGDGWHDLRPDVDAADRVVHGVLAVRHPEGRHLGTGLAAVAGDRLLSDGVGDAGRARSVLVRPGRDRLSGTVQADETYIGGEEAGLAGGRPGARRSSPGSRWRSASRGGSAGAACRSWPTGRRSPCIPS